MANRKRNIQVKFYVTAEEKELMEQKMAQLKTKRIGAYLRKMAVDGYAVRVDMADFKALVSLLRICSNNLNQIAAKAHTLNALDVQRYDENCRKLDEAVKAITAAVILPRPMR